MWLIFNQPRKTQIEHDNSSDDHGDSSSDTDTPPVLSDGSRSSPDSHYSSHILSSHDHDTSVDHTHSSHLNITTHHRSSYEELFSHSSTMEFESQFLHTSLGSVSQCSQSDSQLYMLGSDQNPNYQSVRSSTPISFSRHRTPLSRRLSTGSSITITSSDRPLHMTRYQYSIIVHKLRQESKPLTYDNIHQEGLIMFQDYRSFYTGNI